VAVGGIVKWLLVFEKATASEGAVIVTTPTMVKFGYPASLIHEDENWAVLVRPQQVTLGSLVLVSREPVQEFSAVSDAGFAAMGPVIRRIERTLTTLVSYERINYLMLMMVDPDVHFHVLPRYSGERRFGDLVFPDAGWPGPPDLKAVLEPTPKQQADLIEKLREVWADNAG